MEELIQFELSKEFLEKLREAIRNRDDEFITNSLSDTNPADISAILDEYDAEDSKYVLDILPRETGAHVINGLDEDTRIRFLKHFTPREIAGYIDLLHSDDAVDILNEQPQHLRREIISYLENEEKVSYILELIRYDEDVAGGLMAKELIKANLNWTVDQCIEEIRRQAENIEKVYSVYVVDDRDKLLGRVDIKKLILSDSSHTVADLYEGNIVSVDAYMEEEEVAAIMAKYDFDSVPVVNMQGKLVGRITIDDIVDVITEQADENRQLMTGISEDVEEDDSIWKLSRARLPWLVIGLAGGIAGAQLIEIFEDDLVKVTAIAFFIPLIMATGGNVGIQSSSLVVQALATQPIFEENNWSRTIKAIIIAVLNGVLLAAFVFAFIFLINDDFKLALVVSLALLNVVVLSSFFGTMIPVVLNRMKINPALASGPFITTINDLVGIGVYFIVAHYLYNL